MEKVLAIAVLLLISGCSDAGKSSPQPSAAELVAELRCSIGDVTRDKWFRECQKIEDDEDAANLYQWGMNAIYEARSNLDGDGNVKDANIVKPCKYFCGYMLIQNGNARLAVRRIGVLTPVE